jgi:PAS domain S-box-containing protein
LVDFDDVLWALDTAEVAIWVVETRRGMVFTSPRLRFLFGLPAETPAWAPTDLFVAAIHAEDRPVVERRLAGSVARGDYLEVEFRVTGKDGRERWLLSRGSSSLDVDGVPHRLTGAIIDITERKRTEDRDRFLVALDDAIRPLTDPKEVMTAAAAMLGRHLDVDRCAYADIEADQDTMNLTGNYVRGPEVRSMVGRLRFADFGADVLARMRRDEPFVVDDVDTHQPPVEDLAAYRLGPIQAVICVPLHKGGRFVAAMAVHCVTARHWRPEEVELVRLVAARCWESIERARIDRNLRESEARFRFLDTVSAATRSELDPARAMAATTRLLGEHLRVMRCAYADVDDDRFTIRDEWAEAGVEGIAGTYSLALLGRRTNEELKLGRTLVVRDVEAESGPEDAGDVLDEIGVGAIVCCPLVKEGRLRAMMAVHHPNPRDWTLDEVALIEEVAERSWTHIERVRAEAALRESEDRFRTIFESASDDVIVLIDPGGSILAWNPAAELVCGWTAEEAIGQPVGILFTPKDRLERVPETEMELATRHGRASDERWHIRKDASLFWGSGTMNALCHADGSVRGYLKVFRDATARHEMESRIRALNDELEKRVDERTAALVAKNQELEGFSYSVAHDMRSPLRAIVSNARIALEEEGPRISEPGQRNLMRLSQAALKMAHLVDDLLQYARLGTREVRREEVDLGALARRVADEVLSEHADPSLTVRVTCESKVACDPRLVGMALHNLIDNACKYRRADGPAEIEFSCIDDHVFVVRDNGIGFDMAYLPKLFIPFERLHREEYDGTGIGLANVKRAIERHGGRVWAEGELGKGASFFFTLPR